MKPQKSIKDAMDLALSIRGKIIENGEKPPCVGEMVCPVCGRIAKYGIASNGHVRYSCDAKCISFTE